MSYSIPVRPRATELTAFQFVLGQTTATQLREFAGEGNTNIGIAGGDERDLRWVLIKTVRAWTDLGDGEWIIRDEHGALDTVDGIAFAALFHPATVEAAQTLRSRDVNDPKVRAAQALAVSFAASLRG